MSWPWVNRQDADARYAQYADQVVALNAQLSATQAKYDALLVSHLAYLVPTKTESTAAPMPAPALVPVERKLSRIAQTIREHAAGDTRLAAWLWDKARDLKAAGKDEAYIVERLVEWDSTEPEE